MSRASERILRRFSVWFASAAGVWQTALVTAGIVVAERLLPHADPNGFWLLYALTVYSGVTQPALAYVGVQASNKLDAVIERISANGDADLAEDTAQTVLLHQLAADVAALRVEMAQLRAQRDGAR